MQCFSPYAALKEHASRQPAADAIIIDGTRITYAALLERVTACASWLLHHGLIPGEVTGICIRDEIDHVVCAVVLLCLHTLQISLGSHERSATKRELVRKVGVTQLIAETVEDWMDGLRTIVVPVCDPSAMSAAPGATGAAFRASPLGSIAVYQSTSGSTGLPRTFGITLARLLLIAERYASDPKERRTLRTGSIEFDAHRLNRVCSLIAGNTCVFLRHLDVQSLTSLCERAAVSVIHMGAYKLASLIQSKTHVCARLPSCTAISSGGSRVPGHLRKTVKALLTDNLWVQYATSEAGLISVASPDEHEAFPEGVGFPPAEVKVEIVGADGESLDPGEIGQIRISKAIMTDGYIAEPSTSSNFRNGWFYPGDLLSREEGGPLIFHGRADDMMILDGINIFPSTIEDTLESHPDILEAVAFPVKSRIHGEIPVAAVVLSAAATTRDTSHFLNWCRQSLGVRAPRQILVVESIPRNSAGKPLRRELVGS